MDTMKLQQSASCSVVRGRGTEDNLHPHGHYVVEHVRDGKVIGRYEFPNNVTNEAKTPS